MAFILLSQIAKRGRNTPTAHGMHQQLEFSKATHLCYSDSSNPKRYRLPTLALYYFLTSMFCIYSGISHGATSPHMAIEMCLSEKVEPAVTPDWSKPTFNDATWTAFTWDNLPAAPTQYWMRNTFTLTQTKEQPQGVLLSVLGAYSVYWDGELLGSSGTLGTSAVTEVPGPHTNIFFIPEALYTPGRHTIGLHISSYHSPKKLRQRHYWIQLGQYDDLLSGGLKGSLLPLAMLGAIVIIGLYYLMMAIFYQRKPAIFLFSLLCFSMALLLFCESYRGMFGYAYHWHWYRLVMIMGLAAVVGLLLLAFLLYRFNLPNKKYWLAGTSILLLLSCFGPNFDLSTYLIFLMGSQHH